MTAKERKTTIGGWSALIMTKNDKEPLWYKLINNKKCFMSGMITTMLF